MRGGGRSPRTDRVREGHAGDGAGVLVQMCPTRWKVSRHSEGELTSQGEEHEESHGFECSLNINGLCLFIKHKWFMLVILVTHPV